MQSRDNDTWETDNIILAVVRDYPIIFFFFFGDS